MGLCVTQRFGSGFVTSQEVVTVRIFARPCLVEDCVAAEHVESIVSVRILSLRRLRFQSLPWLLESHLQLQLTRSHIKFGKGVDCGAGASHRNLCRVSRKTNLEQESQSL